jgi:hypothetical protein
MYGTSVPYPYVFGFLRSASGSVSQGYGSEDPDPHPDAYRTSTKMSRIPNTAKLVVLSTFKGYGDSPLPPFRLSFRIIINPWVVLLTSLR